MTDSFEIFFLETVSTSISTGTDLHMLITSQNFYKADERVSLDLIDLADRTSIEGVARKGTRT